MKIVYTEPLKGELVLNDSAESFLRYSDTQWYLSDNGEAVSVTEQLLKVLEEGYQEFKSRGADYAGLQET